MAKSTWAIDPTHSEISFKVKHMMITNVSGKFDSFDATIESEGEEFENSEISFTAQAKSINTGNADRDNHLRGADFFDADHFGTINFKSTTVQKGNNDDYIINGDLTIKDVTKNITLEAEYGSPTLDPWGNNKIGLSITGKINRKDFGLTWNTALESGGVLVGEEIKLAGELQFVKK